MAPQPPRGSAPTTVRVAESRTTSTADRMLHALGADPAFAEAVLGDLAEEYARRSARDGVGAAQWWYASEALRSAPHFVRSAIRHGGARTRARLAAWGAAVALAVTLAVTAVLTRNGPPARLVAGAGDAAEGIVVNNVRPVQLPVRVLDAAGHLLKSDGVRYRWMAGAPIAISSQGVVTCTERGDATVRASLGPVVTHLDVRCRPVRAIQAGTWISLVAGDLARDLPFTAIGADGQPVMQLRGAVRVVDSTVATLAGATIRPLAAGETAVAIEVGDRGARVRVLVHEPVHAFMGLRSDQRLVAVPVRLARGDTVTWALPRGAFWLKYLPRGATEAPPTITLGGIAACSPGDGLAVYRVPLDEFGTTYCLVHADGASVTVAHGAAGAPLVSGWLALERVEHR